MDPEVQIVLPELSLSIHKSEFLLCMGFIL